MDQRSAELKNRTRTTINLCQILIISDIVYNFLIWIKSYFSINLGLDRKIFLEKERFVLVKLH